MSDWRELAGEEREPTAAEDKWMKELARVLRRCPRRLEMVVVRDGLLEVRWAGDLRAHLDRDSGFGMNGGELASISTARLYPYGEGC